MPDRTPAETLTAAADKLEALVAGVTLGPWRYNPDKMWNLPGQHFGEEFIAAGPPDRPICVAATGDADDPQSMVDAAYIAAMNPDVGRALVALLRTIAAEAEFRPAAAVLYREDLNLARAILGTKEDT